MTKQSLLLLELYGLFKYLKEIITSCIYVDNSIRNLDVAQDIGINTILFNKGIVNL